MAAWSEVERRLPPAALKALREAEEASKKSSNHATAHDVNDEAHEFAQSIAAELLDEELLRQQAAYQNWAIKAQRFSLLQETPPANLLRDILANGVVRINDAIPKNLCDKLREATDKNIAAKFAELDKAGLTAHQEGRLGGFGRVNSREKRYDLYVRNEGVYNQALACLLQSKVGDFLRSLFDEQVQRNDSIGTDTRSGRKDSVHHTVSSLAHRENNACGIVGHERVRANFWELSTMTSDPGASRQKIHPDTPYTEKPILFTVFVALQDVQEDMGPTLFLPGTHTKQAHQKFLSGDENVRKAFLSEAHFSTPLLRKGDAQVMDSRILHAGLGNHDSMGRRRRLFYFTIQNPRCSSSDFIGIPKGSMWDGTRLNLADFS